MTVCATAKVGSSEKKKEIPVVLDNGKVRLSVSESGEFILEELTTKVVVRIHPNSYDGGGFRLSTSSLLQPVSVNGKIEWQITHR